MTNKEALLISIGDAVEIRYIGRGEGRIERGKVKSVAMDGSHVDIDLDSPPYGIKWGVPSTIVHWAIHPAFQAKMNRLLPTE